MPILFAMLHCFVIVAISSQVLVLQEFDGMDSFPSRHIRCTSHIRRTDHKRSLEGFSCHSLVSMFLCASIEFCPKSVSGGTSDACLEVDLDLAREHHVACCLVQ